ncbi:MAG: nemA [Phycisphaerales bacterium]|nr:nemA [Phycisphaerales bacterium]
MAAELDKRKLAYPPLIEPRINGNAEVAAGLAPVAAVLQRKVYAGTIIAAGGFDADGAASIVRLGDADLDASGRLFIANLDLPRRFAMDPPLNAYDRATFYGGDQRGYADHPSYDATAARASLQQQGTP